MSHLDIFKTSAVVRQINMVTSPAGLGTKNFCAGKAQQQFTRPDPMGHGFRGPRNQE
jgi:hypothetical protein